MEEEGHSDELFHDVIKKYNLSGPDVGMLKRLAFGTIERIITLDAMIRRFADRPVKKMDPDVRTLLRMGFYELIFMDSIPYYATCDEIQKLTDHSGKRGYINAILRGYVREYESEEHEDPWDRLGMYEKLSIPKDLWDMFEHNYGKKTTGRIARSFLDKQGEVSIHVDTTKIDLEEFKNSLPCESEYGRYMKDTLILKGTSDITELPGYNEGYFYVQDESSQLPVLVADIHPGDTVVDVCGAPGGKALHVLMELQDTGTLSIRDVSEDKLSRVRENMRRMRYINAEVKCFDGRETDTAWKGRADVVLCDVPCSGYGIIGRKPELKFRPISDIDELVPIQREIVAASVSMLKKGGVLIYSTCTISHRENDDNADWIEKELGLVPESLDQYIPEALTSIQTAHGRLQVLPGLYEMDGFFVARFRKVD